MWPDIDDGEGEKYLQRHPNVGKSGSEGERVEMETGRGWREGAPPPLGGRGTPEEQAQEIVERIINQQSGRSPPSGQAPAPHRCQTRPTWGGRGGGDRDRSSGGRGGGRRGDIGGRGSRTPPTKKAVSPRGDRAKEDTEPASEEGEREGGDTDRVTPKGSTGEVVCVGGLAPSREKR